MSRSGHHHHHHRNSVRAERSKRAVAGVRTSRRLSGGRRAASLCLAFALAGLFCIVAGEAVHHDRTTSGAVGLNIAAGFAIALSLALGLIAVAVQQRQWSRRARNRLVLGFPIALLSLLMLVVDAASRGSARGGLGKAGPSPSALSSPEPVRLAPLFQSGWYGEAHQDGLLLVVTSFHTNSVESRAFNRALRKPVSYATLSVINLGSAAPVVLRRAEVFFLLDSGETQSSLEVKPLLAPHSEHAALRKRLAVPREVKGGGMVADLPICVERDFPWERVAAVLISLHDRTCTIPGRMMTEKEKRALLEQNTERASTANTTNRDAEAWFKHL